MLKRKVVPYDRTRRKKHWQMADPPAKSSKRRGRGRKKKRPLRWLILLPIAAYLVFGTVGDAAMGLSKGASQCKLVAVVDGDTVTIWCGGTVFERTRLTGYDTPEIFSPQCNSELWLGIRATFALKGALWSADRIVIQPTGRDRYDRVLARMTVDGRSVGNTLIARGLARPYFGNRRAGWCDAAD